MCSENKCLNSALPSETWDICCIPRNMQEKLHLMHFYINGDVMDEHSRALTSFQESLIRKQHPGNATFKKLVHFLIERTKQKESDS